VTLLYQPTIGQATACVIQSAVVHGAFCLDGWTLWRWPWKKISGRWVFPELLLQLEALGSCTLYASLGGFKQGAAVPAPGDEGRRVPFRADDHRFVCGAVSEQSLAKRLKVGLTQVKATCR
jgi:hypothetical protein